MCDVVIYNAIQIKINMESEMFRYIFTQARGGNDRLSDIIRDRQVGNVTLLFFP